MLACAGKSGGRSLREPPGARNQRQASLVRESMAAWEAAAGRGPAPRRRGVRQFRCTLSGPVIIE